MMTLRCAALAGLVAMAQADEMTGPPPCDVHTDQGRCEEMHCAWDGSVCADPPPCDTHTDQGSCAADMHCAWDGSACTETTGPPPICGDPYGDGNPFDCGENTLLPDTPCDRATGCTAETCCTPPQTGGTACVGEWSACSDMCIKTYSVTAAATGAGLACEAADQETMDCEAFEGSCTCAEVAGADYCVSPCTWDGSACTPPQTGGTACVGEWSACSDMCIKTYSVTAAATGAGLACEAADQETMDCEAFEGRCTCAEVAGADYCVSPCTWDGSKCDTPETTGVCAAATACANESPDDIGVTETCFVATSQYAPDFPECTACTPPVTSSATVCPACEAAFGAALVTCSGEVPSGDPPQCNTYMDQTTCDGDMYCAWDVDGSACVDYVPPCSYDQSDPCNGDDACFWIEGDGTPAHPPHCAEHVHTGPAIDCSNVPDTAPCHVMELIDAVRDAASLSDIEPSVFCPCKRVRDNAPDANPETVASCNGGGP